MSLIDLTTVAAVNAILEQASGVDAALIGSEITAYSRNILTRTSRRNLSQIMAFNEVYSGTGGDLQQLRNYPVLAVQSLLIGGRSVPASTGPNNAGWVIDYSGSQAAIAIIGAGWYGDYSAGESPWRGGGWGSGNAPPLGLPQYRFVEGRNNVQVAYQAGYALPAVDTPEVPGTSYVVENTPAQFWSDGGVTLEDGTPLTAVPSSPGAMEYVAPAFGVAPFGTYLFNAAQAGTPLVIAYEYGGTPEDLSEAAARLVAVQYRRRQWLGQVSQTQPQIGTTAYSRLETELDTKAVIERYKMRFIPQ